MTEKSYFWTTGGAGDGSSTYSRSDWAKFSKIIAACLGSEGVAPNTLNSLVGSVPGANTARIASGMALVDGKAYDNDANVDVTIPSAVGGGNTRIDRIVLRANWTAQTVRITRIAGTDAASPIAPAITQVSGTTYDIKLYQALVNTSGIVTLTDERQMTQIQAAGIKTDAVETDKIKDLNVTTAKLAASSVDGTKAGNNVLKLMQRLGGNSADWNSTGNNTYVPTNVKMVPGASIGSGSGATNINFPSAFTEEPIIVAIPYGNDTDPTKVWQVVIKNAYVNYFEAYTYLIDLTAGTKALATIPFLWVAIGRG